LLEAQLITYHKGDTSYSFLNLDKIKNYDDLNSLFFQVLARKYDERNPDVKEIFEKVPYLNSSLFEPTEIEHATLFISNLKDDKTIPIIASTVLKNDQGKKRTGKLSTLEYLFEFLNAYDFSSEGSEEIQEENKSLINASVLGLIFEKINGYKDGSFFTPGFITMYMCRETIRKAVVQKFNETKNWQCQDLNELYNKIDDTKEANAVVNSIKICDPAVGSGHFLVSALNEMIAVKNDLKILQDRDGKRLKEYQVEVVNDELIVTDEEGELFEYNPTNKESQRIQETLFHEKQSIIENCLFGVDINPNSVKICRLRLWIELLKNAYYKNATELETLPNIDINIKCGNSLVSRFAIDADLKQALKKSKWTIDSYQIAVDTYRKAQSKEQKREMEQLIADIKSDFRSEISSNDPKLKKLRKLSGELFQMNNQQQLFEMSKKEKAAWNKKITKLTQDTKKLETEIEEIKANKIFENAFEWRFEFPEVLNDDGDFVGFDAILGNPPYVAVSRIHQNERDYIFSKFPDASSRIDLFGIFTQFGTQILKDNGLLTFIIPMQLLKNTAFSNIRKNLLSNTSIHKINYVGSSIFEDANNDTIVIEYENVTPNNDFEIEIKISDSSVTGLNTKAVFGTKQSLFLKDDFSITLSSSDELLICDKLESISTQFLSDKFNIIQGIVSGLNGAYIFDGELNTPIEQENLKPYLLGSDFKEYSINKDSRKQILYLDKTVSIEKYPNTKKWLSQFKEKLDKRREVVKGVIPWYSLQWPRDKNSFQQPKIIFQKIRNQRLRQRLVGTYDSHNYFVGDGVIFLTSKTKDGVDDLKYVLGLLNSELYNFYYRQKYLDVNLKIMFLEKTPIIHVQGKKQIVQLVEKMLTTKASNNDSNTKSIKSEIDQIIYNGLGLNKEEIEIIEKSNN
jgi:galactitol-specific phosphotransferase system IIB component